ncbi:MAG: HAD-IC family P-type ATPase, partial [Candidatus Moraniibacteriota bacterium]
RRLSALQDLANVNLLLTDKTGTLTKNEISVANVISYQSGMSTDDVIELAHLATSADTPDAIDLAVTRRFQKTGRSSEGSELLNFTPYDSERKHSTALIQRGTGKILISLGAPQVIRALDEFALPEMAKRFESDIREAAQNGFRVLAVATKKESVEESHMEIAGVLFLADPLDERSKETMHFMRENGIAVKMLTGDNRVIAERIAQELDLVGDVFPAEEARKLFGDAEEMHRRFDSIAAFAEILPKDKYEIVKAFQSKYVVASTGDGINDLPALKVANVGIAVSGAVSALKSMADIVLLGQGLSVIQDAILESRKIFVRLYNYSVYRISESFRLVITILILGVWYGFYPLVPLQLILLAFLNDIPIISLAFDRVRILAKPSEVNVKERLALSLLFGSVGVMNSILLFFLMTNIFHLSLPVIQTIFFLKLTVSGHALVFVAHTKERWYRFLPSRAVILSTITTQVLATALAVTGFLMPASISLSTALLVWIWAFIWMQISELMKDIQMKFFQKKCYSLQSFSRMCKKVSILRHCKDIIFFFSLWNRMFSKN